MTEQRAWMIRAGNDNELIDYFTEHEWAAIGWSQIGDLSSRDSRDAVKQTYESTYVKHSDGKRNVNVGQLYRFAHVLAEGDLVLSYEKSSREYIVGKVTGGYLFNPTDALDEYPHVRPVDWRQDRIPRDDFSTPSKNTLGGTMTVFSLDDIIPEIEEMLTGERPEPDDEEDGDEDAPPFHVDVESKADELISDIIAHIDDERFEDLVAAILRAMGYEAQTTSGGADHGVDVVAHPDSFGFNDPLIKAQVKHRSSKTSSGDIRDFIGTLGNDEKGLFVSTGGYTNSAREEAERTDHRVKLIDRDEFVDLLLDHYKELESEFTNLVPLTQVYVPMEES